MTEFKGTPSQTDAVLARGSAVLVSAGAGSGKTRVLTERLMDYILNENKPVMVDSFVIITFTQAAAAELKNRISARIAEEIAKEIRSGGKPERLNLLRLQQVRCRKAQIGTIHHFCAQIIRENGHLIGIPSDFKVISDERAASLRERALDDVLEMRYADMASFLGFEELVNTVGTGIDDRELRRMLFSLYEKMQCHARPDRWAEKMADEMDEARGNFGNTAWSREILSEIERKVNYWSEELDRIMEAIVNDPVVAKGYMAAFTDGADQVREFARRVKLGWEAAADCPPIAFKRLGSVPADVNPELTEKAKTVKSNCAGKMKDLQQKLKIDASLYELEMNQSVPAMKAMLRLALDFSNRFSELKRKECSVDYSDLEHYAAELLINPDGTSTELARSVSARCTEVMVDEYQDVSSVQDDIFKAVSNDGKKLFMVGDVKQSIYRFRLADPSIFNGKLHSFSLQTANDSGKKILLRENFRSRKEILNCANAVFSRCMSTELGEIDYDESAALVYGSDKYSGNVPKPEILIFEKKQGRESRQTQEAAAVAKKIETLMSSGFEVTDNGGSRPLDYGDIAVLLRSANATGGTYRRELVKRGIPVAAGQGGGLFETREIGCVVSMLKAMDNPYDDVHLISTLSSPLFGFSADDLAEIRSADRHADFFSALKKAAQYSEIFADFLDTFNGLRAMASDVSSDRLVRTLMDRTDIRAVCSAMPDGNQRIANLMHFVQLAADFEASGCHGLHEFVLYIERIAEKGKEIPAAAAASSAVQILSIHKSKGLEFPVVFLCDTSHQFNTGDVKEPVLIHPELGLGPSYVDHENAIKLPTLARTAVSMRLKREALSEEMRIAYVALTRAKERLFITAIDKDPQKMLEDIKKQVRPGDSTIDPEIIASANSMIKWFTEAAVADDGENITLTIVPAEEDEPILENVPAEEAAQEYGEEYYAELERNLSFVYGYPESVTIPSKLTATEVKNYEKPDDEAGNFFKAQKRYFPKPDFSRENSPVSGAEKGIATHLALQFMDISHTDSRENVRFEIERLKEAKFLSARQAGAVDVDAIAKLFASPLGERMRSAQKVHREFRFSLLCPANDYFNAREDEEILLQGVVDCCLEEDGKLVIIDYKTDSLRSRAQLEERRELYAGQVKAYSRALSRIFGMEVKETVLYFLSIGEMVTV